jgi:hypothetical protein
MRRNKKGQSPKTLPIRMVTGCGAQVAPQRCPILRASNKESTMESSYSSLFMKPMPAGVSRVYPSRYPNKLEETLNTFCEHHQHNIAFHYRCFDRILLNAAIQPFQQPARVMGFFWSYRQLYPVSRQVLRDIAAQYHNWVKHCARKWGAPVEDAPEEERREVFVTPYFRAARPDQIVAILKAREPARILVSIGKSATEQGHLEYKPRWVDQYNFYIHDRAWGRMFVRVCPYFPFPARIYLNQHYWLANRLREQGIPFTQCANAFLRCSDPEYLRKLADSLQPNDIIRCAQKWLACLVPFFTARERRQAGVQHRLFFAQVEYCDNLIFKRRAALDRLGERLLDANRSIGQPNSLTVIFGRRIQKRHQGKLQTVIEDMHLGNPVLRAHYQHGFMKQYVRDHRILRTESATNSVLDYGVNKAVEHLPRVRDRAAAVIDRYLDAQQDILETFLDRGQLQRLSQPTRTASGRRIPGLKLDHPRQLALMHALVRFSHLAAGGVFTTREVHADTAQALGCSVDQYKLGSLRYELSKLRAKGLVEKIPHSRRYRLLPEGYRICVLYLKLFEKIYAPLTAGLLEPLPGDARLREDRIAQLDKLYLAVGRALDNLLEGIGLKAA